MLRDLILGPFGGVLLVLSLALEAIKIWAFVDSLIRPTPAYVAAGKQTKVFWCVILGIAVFVNFSLFALAGLIAAIVYLVDVRPAVRDVGRRGQGGWYG